MLVLVYLFSLFYGCFLVGTRFQAAGNPDEEKDVVAEHEGKTDSFRNPDRIDSHYCAVHLRWLPLLKKNTLIFSAMDSISTSVSMLVYLYIS